MEQVNANFSNLKLEGNNPSIMEINNISNSLNNVNLSSQSVVTNQDFQASQNYQANQDLQANQNLQAYNPTLDTRTIDNYIDSSIEENLYNTTSEHKYLPLEVRNYYSTKYFDDEDFIYFNLSIQPYLLNNKFYAKYNQYEDKFDNLICYYRELLEKLPNEEMLNIDTYKKLVSIYLVVLEFYKVIYNCNDGDINGASNFPNAIKLFNNDMIKEIVSIINYLYEEIDLDCDSENNTHFSIMEKEIIFGIRLITSHINIIVNFYSSNNINFENYKDYHQVRLIRLINNLCVVMIFIKLYHIDYNADVNIFTQFSEHNHEMNS